MTTLGQKKSTSTKEEFITSIDALFLKLELAYHYQFYKVFGTDEKLKEGKNSVLEGVPKSLPAVVKAYRIQEKVRGIGFDWENKGQVWDKVLEEIKELKSEENNNDSKRIEDEFGDVLFALVNYSRFINVNPEDALEKTNKRFIKRFQFLEKQITNDGKKLSDLTFEEMNSYWDLAKKNC